MCNCLDKHSRFGEKHPAFSFLFLSVPRVEGPDHNLWVKFAKQVSSLSFPSCSTSNQIEKKQENYNFRLALSLGNISQKRKHKNPEEKLPTRDVGYIHGGNIILPEHISKGRVVRKKAVLSKCSSRFDQNMADRLFPLCLCRLL